MADGNFSIGKIHFSVPYISSEINSQYKLLCKSIILQKPFDNLKFKKAVFDFLDKNCENYTAQDNFFSIFTSVWHFFIKSGNFPMAEFIWEYLLEILYEWEKNSAKRTHKGTLYYFWGGTCILKKDFEKGFLLMHQALKEDKETDNKQLPGKPAYFFVSLSSKNPNQYFKKIVYETAMFLKAKFVNYSKSRNTKLNFKQFEKNFIKRTDSDILETTFFFTFTIFKLKHIMIDINRTLKNNEFISLLQISILSDLCLIIENLIRLMNPDDKALTFAPHLNFLSSKSKLVLNKSTTIALNADFKTQFTKTLDRLLNEEYNLSNTKLRSIEEDLAITYGLRNFVSHRIENQAVITRNFEELVQRVLNSLFFTIEKLYSF